MSEALSVNPNVVPSFGRRVGAYFIDGAIAGVGAGIGACISSVLSVMLIGVALSGGSGGAMGALTVLTFLIYFVSGIAYPFVMWHFTATRGWTPGKKLVGLAVVDQATGLPIGRGRAALRMLVLAAPSIAGGVVAVLVSLVGGGLIAGVLWFLVAGGAAAAWAIVTAQHPRQQGWHDLAAKSVVVPLDPSTGQFVPPVPPTTQAHAPSVSPPGFPSFGQPSPPPVPVPSAAPPAPALTPQAPPPTPQAAPPPVPPLIPPAPRLVPPPPGVPGPSVSAPVPPPQPPAPPHGEADRFAMTVTGDLRRGPTWSLTTADGASRVLEGTVVVGRNPEPTAEFASAVAWRVSDPELSMSKSHAAFGLAGGELWVQDLGSTNGVAIQRNGTELPVAVGARTPVLAGDVVLLGDVPLRVGDGR